MEGLLIVIFIIVMVKERGRVKLFTKDKQFLTLKVALIFYSVLQFLFINHFEGVSDQLFKGIVSLGIDFLVIVAFVSLVNSGRTNYNEVLNIFYIIGCINIPTT